MSCPSQSIPAAPIEQLVVEQIQRLGRDPLVREQMLATVRQQDEAPVAEWEGERVGLERDLLRGQGDFDRGDFDFFQHGLLDGGGNGWAKLCLLDELPCIAASTTSLPTGPTPGVRSCRHGRPLVCPAPDC